MATAQIADLRQQQPARPLAEMKPKEQISYLLNQKKGELAKMLPKTLSIDRLLKVAQIAATTTPALAKCDVPSLVGAIGQCAQMGLEPNTVLGHAYLVPFNTKRKDANGNERWVNSVQVIIGYKGLIDLARRSGQIVSIAAHEVCENDHFELVYGLDEKLNHTPAMGERGDIIGFYAVAKLKDGGHSFEFMSRQQVEEIRLNSQSAYKDEWVRGQKTGNRIPKDGPWWQHFVEMGRKTVIRRLAKYLPLSIEFQTAVALDNQAESGKDQRLDTIDGDFMVVPDEEAPTGVDRETGEILSLADQWKKYDEVVADYGEKEAENFMPREPRPTTQAKPQRQAQAAPADDDWQPSEEELAAIHAREMAEASADRGEPAQPALAARRTRAAAQQSNLE